MFGAGAVQTFPLSRFSNAETLLNLLSAGASVPGRIVADGAGLALALPQFRLPLPKDTPLAPGTLVDVRVVEDNSVKQLQLQPRAAIAAASSPAAAASATLLNEILSLLPSPVPREQAIALLPQADGLPKEAVRALLGLLVGRERLGAALAQLADAIDVAVTSGRLPAAIREQFAAMAGRMLAENTAEFERVVAAARELLRGHGTATQSPRGNADASLLDELIALREQILSRGAGGSQIDHVLKTIDALVERFDAARMQNVRGFETPYQFIEVPLAKQTGFNRAQVHFFGDESRGAAGKPGAHSVVLDLDLSQLGPVWIALLATGRTCACVMRIASDAARQALSDAAPSLEDALRAAGYDGATVRAESWDGDRVAALVSMSSRFAGFEASA